MKRLLAHQDRPLHFSKSKILPLSTIRILPPGTIKMLGRLALTAVLLLWYDVASGQQSDPPETVEDKATSEYADAANFQTGGATDLAIDAWKNFLDRYPKHEKAPEAAHFLGVCYMQREKPDYPAASKAFARALQKKDYPLREESLVNHGWCLYASAGTGETRDTRRLRQAIEAFQTLRSENPKSRYLDRALFYIGEATYGLGKPAEAVKVYDQMLALPSIKDSPLRCDALYARGVAHEDLQQIDQAFHSYDQLISSCDREALVTDVHLRIGDLMVMQRKYDEAIESFGKAFESTEADEDRAYALFRQAYALVQVERPGEAAKRYEQLLAKYPESNYAGSAVLASAQSSYRNGDIDEAAKRFRQVLGQNNPEAATEAAHWLARIEIGRGKAGAAAKLARTQLDRGVDGKFAMDLRLDLAEALSLDPATVKESMRLFEKAYDEDPDHPLAARALYNAAFSALQIGDPERALKLSRVFLKRFPSDGLVPDVRFIAAEGLLASGNAKESASIYKTLLASTSKDNLQRSIWLLRAANAYNASGMAEETVRFLREEMSVLKSPSQRAEAHFLMAEAYRRSGQAAKAVSELAASRQADPSWARAGEAALLEGQVLLGLGKERQATDRWRKLIAADPDSRMSDQARYKLAQLASASGDYKRAIGLFDQIVKTQRDPGLVPYAQYGQGWALMQQGDYDPALKSLDAMLSKHKQHALRNDATLARGITLRNLGRLDQAKTELELYLAIPPEGTNLGHALYELALIDQQARLPGDAAKKLERLVKEVPDYPSMDKVLYELGWSLQENGDGDKAVQHFASLISRFPETSLVGEAAYFVAQKYYAAKDWKRAARQFDIAATKTEDPDLSEKSLYRLGWCHFKDGNYEASEKAFERQSDQHPEGSLGFDGRMMVGEARFKRGQFADALEVYEKVRQEIRRNDDNSKSLRDPMERQVRELVLLHGGQSAGQLKDWDKAIEWYEELRKRFPASTYLPQVFYELGFAHQQDGDQERALKFFREVADNYRNELAARARFMIGEIFFAGRQFDKAIPEFQRVMFGFGADKAPARIKNWQAKSGYEAGRCSELLAQAATTPAGRQKALNYAKDFYGYVAQQHPDHELADDSQERSERLETSRK